MVPLISGLAVALVDKLCLKVRSSKGIDISLKSVDKILGQAARRPIDSSYTFDIVNSILAAR
jgi:hypothetical protein